MRRSERIEPQARVAFAEAVAFAASREDLDAPEMRLYMDRAFEQDAGAEFGTMARRLHVIGELPNKALGECVVRALFYQCPSVLAQIAVDWPHALAIERADGIDVCRVGLSMAISALDEAASAVLSRTIAVQPQGMSRMGRAFEEAMVLCAPGARQAWCFMSSEEESSSAQRARAIVVRCEREVLRATIPSAPMSGKRGAAL